MTPGVERFFEQVSDAYQQSPWELVGIFVLVLGLLGGLVIYGVFLSRRQSRQQKRLRDRLFEEKARELKLDTAQRELIARMGQYLKESGNLYKLLTDQIAFNAAAARLREIEHVGPQAIAALRLALGYQTSRQDQAPHSSAAIPEDATVLLVRNKYRQPIKAKTLARQAQSFQVTILEEGARIPTGATLSVYFQNSAGVFTFEASVLSQEGGVLQLSHSEQIKQYQKRKYYRRRIDLPVHVYPFDEDKPILSRFKDIGGGGASLVNPDHRFKAGDDLELRFKPAGDLEVRLTASVVRLSEGGKVIHVNYEHIRDSLRDRIYHAIFKPPKDEEEAAQQRQGKPAQKPQRPAPNTAKPT